MKIYDKLTTQLQRKPYRKRAAEEYNKKQKKALTIKKEFVILLNVDRNNRETACKNKNKKRLTIRKIYDKVSIVV